MNDSDEPKTLEQLLELDLSAITEDQLALLILRVVGRSNPGDN